MNETKNQHYLSQAEQRLNALDATVPSRGQRIFAFDVVDRDLFQISLREPAGQAIKRSLSFTDLFSFDIVDARYRRNLEDQFQRYERDIGAQSRALLHKLRAGPGASINDEVVNLFATKLMNFARNPYCVRKALNTFGAVAKAEFTDVALRSEFERAMKGWRPHRAAVCGEFGLTSDEYDLWLRMLFNLFLEPPNGRSLFDETIKGLFETSLVTIHVFDYGNSDPDAVCLLSDRGFNVFDVPLRGGAVATTFEFNVCSRAFASFSFCDPRTTAESAGLRPDIVDAAAGRFRGHVRVLRYEDLVDMLVMFNRRTLYHSAGAVFAASATPRLR